MKILNIQKTTFQMPPYNGPWPEVLMNMVAIYQNQKYRLNKSICDKLVCEHDYYEWTATLNGERVTIIQAYGLIPVQTVRSILL